MPYSEFQLPVELFETNFLTFDHLLHDDLSPKSSCFEIHSSRTNVDLTLHALHLAAHAQSQGFEIIWLDVLRGRISWSLAHPDASPYNLNTMGINTRQFTNIPLHYLTEEEILGQLSHLLEKSKCLVILDDVHYLELLLSTVHRQSTRSDIQVRVARLIENISDYCNEAQGILVVLN